MKDFNTEIQLNVRAKDHEAAAKDIADWLHGIMANGGVITVDVTDDQGDQENFTLTFEPAVGVLPPEMEAI